MKTTKELIENLKRLPHGARIAMTYQWVKENRISLNQFAVIIASEVLS